LKETSTGFRKIDVDSYGEDVFKDEDLHETQATTNLNEQEIRKLVQSNKFAEALRKLLDSAPLTVKNAAVKDAATNLVLQVLLGVKTSEIDKTIEGLDVDQIDVLMKYIYRGFELPSDGSSANLLIWHEKTFAKGGVGSIVRVLTDKKRV